MAEARRAALRREALPAKIVPLLYFATARLFLACAFLAAAWDPHAVSGFFFHARMAAIVHMITLGWISGSILGAIYVIGPLALRMRLPVGATDVAAYVFVTVGIAGMVSHFWIEEFTGMAWSAGMVVLAAAYVASRIFRSAWRAPLDRAVKLHVLLAFANFFGAATMGILLGLDKRGHFLPGFILTNTFAHAHLAVVGWACMMVVGAGYRLLPMFLPSAMPAGRGIYASAVLLEAGAVGLFVCLLARSALVPLAALVAIAGFAAFLAQVAWMLRHPRPAPPSVTRPDFGMLHALQALAYLALASALGLALALAPMTEWTLRLGAAYGVLGLVGFLAQMVLGIESRLLPMFALTHAIVEGGYSIPPAPPLLLRACVLLLWSAGVPALASGFLFEAPGLVAAGAWMLLAGVLLSAVNSAMDLCLLFQSSTFIARETRPG